MKCQCKNKGKLLPHMADWYDKEKERPFVNHKPNECRGTNELTKYYKDGKKIWLCSCCVIGENKV